VSQSLSRWQAVVLGLVVLAAVAAGGYGVARIAQRQGLWADSFEATAGFPDAHDVGPGTPVRVRGVDAGQVVAVEYPDHDGPGAEVTVRMQLHGKFAGRVYADATAQIHGSGLLGSKVIAIRPGTPQAGALSGGRLRGLKPFGADEAVAEVRGTADEVRKLAAEAKVLVKEVRDSDGTLMKLVRDDGLHRDIRSLVAKTDKAVANLDAQAAGLGGFVAEGRDTLRSVRQGTDALSKLPLVRSYVEDAAALLVRPGAKRDMWPFHTRDLFESGTSVLTEGGLNHLNNTAILIKQNTNKNADVVVVAFCDPLDRTQTAASAQELTKKQAERIVEHFRSLDVHKMGTFSRRKITPLGMGTNPSPVVEKEELSPARVQILLFTPQ
jgi:phospholipid/cholesterol/gamma-HCH transport system substrate-binding protein